jgi:Ca2+-binding EF-hand superfamily protein
VCRELQRLIRSEASRNMRNNTMNYRQAFELFDVDKEGTISNREFHDMLAKVQVMDAMNDKNVNKLLSRFDKQTKGYVTLEDFIAFAENADYGLRGGFETDVDMDEEVMH